MIVDDFLLSSGNLQADRRFEYARAFAENGDFPAAIELLAQTVELTPNWPSLHFMLGKYHKETGHISAAALLTNGFLQEKIKLSSVLPANSLLIFSIPPVKEKSF